MTWREKRGFVRKNFEYEKLFCLWFLRGEVVRKDILFWRRGVRNILFLVWRRGVRNILFLVSREEVVRDTLFLVFEGRSCKKTYKL